MGVFIVWRPALKVIQTYQIESFYLFDRTTHSSWQRPLVLFVDENRLNGDDVDVCSGVKQR